MSELLEKYKYLYQKKEILKYISDELSVDLYMIYEDLHILIQSDLKQKEEDRKKIQAFVRMLEHIKQTDPEKLEQFRLSLKELYRAFDYVARFVPEWR